MVIINMIAQPLKQSKEGEGAKKARNNAFLND